MVGSVNKVILLGNLGRDPEIRSLQTGNNMATFSLATSKRWKDKSTQEQKDKTSWHNIVIFGDGLVNIVEKYVKKGSKIFLEGELNTRKWQDQSGNDRYTTEVVLQGFNCNLTLLDNKGSNNNMIESEGNQLNKDNNLSNIDSQTSDNKDNDSQTSDNKESEDLEDDIPF